MESITSNKKRCSKQAQTCGKQADCLVDESCLEQSVSRTNGCSRVEPRGFGKRRLVRPPPIWFCNGVTLAFSLSDLFFSIKSEAIITTVSTRCTHISAVSRRDVHHEARLTCLEKDWQPTLEVAQEEVASQKACSSTGQELILVDIWGYSIAW